MAGVIQQGRIESIEQAPGHVKGAKTEMCRYAEPRPQCRDESFWVEGKARRVPRGGSNALGNIGARVYRGCKPAIRSSMTFTTVGGYTGISVPWKPSG